MPIAGDLTADTAPPCVGQHELFDSRHPLDHARARDICATCSVILKCRQRLEDVQRAAGPLPGPEGTWAGKLVGPREIPARRRLGPVALPDIPDPETGEYDDCGTMRAYKRHRNHGNPACEACLQANRVHERKRRRDRGAA